MVHQYLVIHQFHQVEVQMIPHETDWIFIPATPKSEPLARPTVEKMPNQPKYKGPPLQFGGLPVPLARPMPKSVSRVNPILAHVDHQQVAAVSQPAASPQPIPIFGQHVKPPVSRGTACKVSQQSDVLRIQYPSKSAWLVQEWRSILLRLGSDSSVFRTLEQSDHPEAHAARLLDQFAASTLLRYFAAWQSFRNTLHSLNLSIADLSEAQLADVLIATSLSKKSDCSAGSHITIKSIRWVATHAGVQGLRHAWSPLIDSFLRSRIPKELKEALPLSLYTVWQLERRLLMSACSTVETVIIGAILVCMWSGMRFADAQRCSYHSFCFDGTSLRGSCWRTKTSSSGQPWGLLASGFMSLGTFNWVEKWLTTMDDLWHQAKSTNLDMPVPDFLFPKLGTSGIEIPWTPMTYADALAWLRYATALPWKSSTQQSIQWTAHSMKSTLLAWGAQLIAEGKVTPEERMLQGHHRQGTSKSLRIYSRDDVHGQLSFQQKVINFVRRGGRFRTAQHRGAQHPMDEPPIQAEFFRKESLYPKWKCFQFAATSAETSAVEELPQDTTEWSDSDSSDSSSSSSEESDAAEPMPNVRKKPKTTAHVEAADEILVGFVTNVATRHVAHGGRLEALS